MRYRASILAVALLAVALGSGSAARAAPENDDFANARAIGGLPFSEDADTTGATTEPGEPDAFEECAASGASLWYGLTAGQEERIDLDVTASEFAATVGVYTGTSLADLTVVACDSEVELAPTPGTTYWIQAGGADLDSNGEIVPLTGLLRIAVFAVPSPCDGCPAFVNYAVPRTIGGEAGETSIGVNPKTNAAMFLNLTRTVRGTWDDSVSPAKVTWKLVSARTTSLYTNDPILWTDRATGRTFVAQLVVPWAGVGPPPPVGASIVAYTDDDGESWITTQPAHATPGWDHESVGGGPYPPSLDLSNSIYPNAVYYCAQAGYVSESSCSRSDDGGLTWGPPLPMNVAQCAGLHGHIVVSESGTVFVPHKSCGSTQGLLYSADAGLRWSFARVPGTRPSGDDPGIAIDGGGRLYFAAESGGRPVVSVSDDAKSWSKPKDVGKAFGIRNVSFPMAVAGDAGRAAVAFYGTTDPGINRCEGFEAAWHIYVVLTYDGGDHWATTDVTPFDPVQRGGISGEPCRNLLDFQGMTMDAYGRVLVGYADGCISTKCRGASGTSLDSRDSQGVIARQTTGPGLLAAYDDTF